MQSNRDEKRNFLLVQATQVMFQHTIPTQIFNAKEDKVFKIMLFYL